MKKLFVNLFSLIFFTASQLLAQQFSSGSPEWLVDKFFGKSSFPEKANYYSGEMLKEVNEVTIGEELNGEGEVSFRQIKLTNSECVFAVEVKTVKKNIDFYCYLIFQDGAWKINAIRRFLFPSFIYTVKDSLKALNSLSPNDSSFYLSLLLFTMSDKELKNYLSSNQNKFKELVDAFNNNSKEKADKLLSSLGCNAVYMDREYAGCIFVQILAFERMEAGFIYSDKSAKLPQISATKFIYIEEVMPGWFIYRTM